MRRLFIGLASLGFVAGGCGVSASPPQAATATATTTGTRGLPATDDRGIAADVPDLQVVDVATGGSVSLRALLPGDKPVLLWFWAPH